MGQQEYQQPQQQLGDGRRKKKHRVSYQIDRQGKEGEKPNIQASEMNSFSLTNIETKPKITINPESTAMASVNAEISPGKTVIPVIGNER
jgi:hypothetical protein